MFSRDPLGPIPPKNHLAVILEDRFEFHMVSEAPTSTPTLFYFTVGPSIFYEPFWADFGPMALPSIYRFCSIVNEKLEDRAHKRKKLAFYTDILDTAGRTNAAFLVGAWQILFLHRSAEEAYTPLKGMEELFKPFRDAATIPCTYDLKMLDCLHAVDKGAKEGFIDFTTFDPDDVEYHERVENGDMNWILPGKLIAFATPQDDTMPGGREAHLWTPTRYLEEFDRRGVRTIVRLNQACYDRNTFLSHGFEHFDFFFDDGGVPTLSIVRKFLAVCETEPGVIAVHCKAGLGRTGTLIGCYLMKHHRWRAAEVIAFVRICRPGSIIGPQQQFLESVQEMLWREGDAHRKHAEANHAEPAATVVEPTLDQDLSSTVDCSHLLKVQHARAERRSSEGSTSSVGGDVPTPVTRRRAHRGKPAPPSRQRTLDHSLRQVKSAGTEKKGAVAPPATMAMARTLRSRVVVAGSTSHKGKDKDKPPSRPPSASSSSPVSTRTRSAGGAAPTSPTTRGRSTGRGVGSASHRARPRAASKS